MSAQNGKWVQNFLATHPVFTHDEFSRAQPANRSRHTLNAVLAHYLKGGHLIRVRRALYATVPRGVSAESFVPDPYLITAHVTDDAVIAYHAALQFHGKAYSILDRFTYLSNRRGRLFRFRGSEFLPVQLPSALLHLPNNGGGVITTLHAGGQVRVASLERTLVDVLDSPEHGGGWEEIWRSLASIEFFDLDAVVQFVIARGAALTIARVAFFLEQHADALMVSDTIIKNLRNRIPKQPTYIDRGRASGKLVARWNLIVPENLLSQSWAEVP